MVGTVRDAIRADVFRPPERTDDETEDEKPSRKHCTTCGRLMIGEQKGCDIRAGRTHIDRTRDILTENWNWSACISR